MYTSATLYPKRPQFLENHSIEFKQNGFNIKEKTPKDGDGINNEDPDQNGLHSLPKPISGSFEPRSEKTGLQGFRPGPIQTRLCSHRRWLEA